jgi:hypothetical protein
LTAATGTIIQVMNDNEPSLCVSVKVTTALRLRYNPSLQSVIDVVETRIMISSHQSTQAAAT